MKTPYTQAVNQILRWVVKHRKHFEKNPKPLAYLMSFHDEIHYGSRHDQNEKFHDWENPKNAILELEAVVGEAYTNLVYDAWGAQIHARSNSRNGEALSEEGKLNKTLEDWVKLCLNPKYRYNSHYPNRKRVLSNCFCSYGTGLGWNKDGYLSYIGPSGVDEDIFFGYENYFDSLPAEIKSKVTEYRQDPIIKLGLAKMEQAKEERKKEEEAIKKITSGKFLLNLQTKVKNETDSKKKKDINFLIDSLKSINIKYKTLEEALFYPMSEYSPLMTMPENVHPSYISGGLEICHMILADPKEAKNNDNGKIAKKFIKKWAKNKK